MRSNSLLLIPLLLSGFVLASCDDDGLDLPEVDCATATVPTYDNVEIFDVSCLNCHSSELAGPARQSAPAEINYDTYQAAVADAEYGAHEVYEGEMPPAGVPAEQIPTEAQKQAFYAWALCGTPQ